MKQSQKNVLTFNQKTFVVISFNANGTRFSTYGTCSPMQAFKEMATHAVAGRRALVLPGDFRYTTNEQANVEFYERCVLVARETLSSIPSFFN